MFNNLFFSKSQDNGLDKPPEKEVYGFMKRPTGLCKICSALDLKEILRHPQRVPGCDRDGKEGKFVTYLGSMKEMRARQCRLCNFWADCAVTEFEDFVELAGKFELRAFSLSSHNLEFKNYVQILNFDSVFLWVVD